MAKIKLSYPDNSDIEIEIEMPILPPPPMQNSVLIPSTWKIDDNEANNVVLYGDFAGVFIIITF